MTEIYERWVAAHGVILVTPVYWYQAPSPLKLMIDRLVCADGGNPDPTITHGKDAEKAKEIELDGLALSQAPRRAAPTASSCTATSPASRSARRALCDWLDWMGLIDAGVAARLDRYIGYYEPYATSHDALDRDKAVQEEVRNVARAVAQATAEMRAGRLETPLSREKPPRPK